MLKVIFFSPEFNSAEAYRAKVKRPFELAISAVRPWGRHEWRAAVSPVDRAHGPPSTVSRLRSYSDVAENWVNTGRYLNA